MRFVSISALALLPMGCGGGGGSGGGARVFTIELTQDAGEHSISGDVALPPDTSSGHAIQFRVDAIDATPPFLTVETVGNTNGDDGFGFRIVGASDGLSYQIRCAIDANDSGSVDSGDLLGWNGGTADMPIQDDDLAPVITIDGESVDGADFGIGPVP